MPYSDNPLRDFEMHDSEQSSMLDRLPVCDICDNPIQYDFYYEINGDNICPECLNNHFRKDNDL